MTQEQKAKAYDDALERARAFELPEYKNIMESVFPELKESKDERIKREILELVSIAGNGNQFEEIKDWLEKQDDKIVDCQQNHQDVKYPNGGIVMEDFNGGEGFYKLHLDYLSKKQVEEVEEMVRTWNKESKISNENIKNCVEMCLTDANEQRFEDFGTTLKDCLAWLEKQGEQNHADKVEPKFKVRDWVILNSTVAQILDKQKYGFVGLDIDGKDFFCNYGHTDSMRHWSINDAKDGDVLIASDDSIFLFAGVDDCACKYYVALTTDNYVKINKETKGGYWEASRAVYPATKEQCDLFFAKMKEAGWERIVKIKN